MRTWEIRFFLPDWLLNYFRIPCGSIIVIEIHISVHDIWREDNSLIFEITFTRHKETPQPHRVEDIIFTVAFLWPNPLYQEEESRAVHAPSCITIVSDNTFDSNNSREGSIFPVPSVIPPGYPTLSPWPPALTPLPTLETSSGNSMDQDQEAVLPIPMPIFTQAPSNTLSVQEIYQRIWSGTDLDQVTFTEGRITFQNLQTLDHQENPQFYSDTPNAAGENSSKFPKDTEEEREVEVEEKEHHSKGEDSQAPLQHCQGSALTLSNYIPDSENASWSISIILEPNPFDQEWEQQITLEINMMFRLPETP